MKKLIELPPISEEENTPLVQTLVGIIELLADRVQKQDEEIALLKDEIKILKGEKKRPKFKPSKMEQSTGEKGKENTAKKPPKKRAGSNKRKRNAHLNKLPPLSTPSLPSDTTLVTGTVM